MLDYPCIEALAAVLREGGFDKAARVLHISQSAVSQRIRSLEDGLGQVLLVRSAPPMATPAGRLLLKHYLQVARLEDDLGALLSPDAGEKAAPLPVGVNQDSLATWFLPALEPFLREEGVLLDCRSDDQDVTHTLLRDGDVLGCVSARSSPMQGCRSTYLGRMVYRLLATPEYVARRFPAGLTREALERAPVLVFNRKDELHLKLLRRALGEEPPALVAHYLPSSEQFSTYIAMGLACGMLPREQSAEILNSGRVVDLAPGHAVEVDLYWHCWNIESRLLARLTDALVTGAASLLEQPAK